MKSRSPRDKVYAVILWTASLLFLALGMRTFFFPVYAAAYYGVATTSSEALIFVQAYGARNIAISLAVICLLWFDMKGAVKIVIAATSLIAAMDAILMLQYNGISGAAKHLVYVSVLLLLAAFAPSDRSRIEHPEDGSH